MKFRDAYLEKEFVLAASGTKIIPISINTPIIALDIIFDAKYGTAQELDDTPIYKEIDKIEVVDGSEVLYSLDMPEAQALNAYEMARLPYMALVSKKNTATKEKVTIRFGRGPYDTKYMLDPTRFDNLQLKITYSFTVDASNWLTNEQKLTVIAQTIEEGAPTPQGFFMNKEIYSWTTATSGDESIDLPKDFKYRMIILRKFYTGERVDEAFTNIKLTCDADRYVPFNLKGSHLAIENLERFGYFSLTQKAMKQDTEIVYSPLADVKGVNPQVAADAKAIITPTIDADQITLNQHTEGAAGSDAWTADTTDREIDVTSFGLQPHHTLCLPFGDIQNPDHMFDPALYESIKLKLTQGGTAGTGQIVVQQLRTY